MDPQETFAAMLAALENREWELVEDASAALRAWMNRGGFPPETLGANTLGNEWHGTIAAFICDLAASRALDALAAEAREGVC